MITALVLSSLPACYARGPRFQKVELDDPNSSLVYIYRLHSKYREGDIPFLYVDDKKILSLKSAGYTWLKIGPGEHTFVLKHSLFFGLVSGGTIKSLNLKTEQNNIYYARYTLWPCGISLAGSMSQPLLNLEPCYEFSLIPEDFALGELESKRYQEAEYKP